MQQSQDVRKAAELSFTILKMQKQYCAIEDIDTQEKLIESIIGIIQGNYGDDHVSQYKSYLCCKRVIDQLNYKLGNKLADDFLKDHGPYKILSDSFKELDINLKTGTDFSDCFQYKVPLNKNIL